MAFSLSSPGSVLGRYGEPTYILEKIGTTYKGFSTDSALSDVSSSSFLTTMQTILNTLMLNGGAVFIKKPTPNAVFDIGSSILQFTFSDLTYGNEVMIIGEGQGPLVITGTGTSMFQCQNSDWGSPVVPRRLGLYNLYFRHNCSNSTDVTLDLLNCYPRGADIVCRQTNATRQGTAWRFGGTNGGGGGAYGQGNVLVSPSALYYGTGFNFSQNANGGPDHFTLIHPYVYSPHNYGFILDHTWFTQLISPEVAVENADAGTVYPYHFVAPNFGNILFGPIVESGSTAGTNPVLTTTSVNVHPGIYGLYAQPGKWTLSDGDGNYMLYGTQV